MLIRFFALAVLFIPCLAFADPPPRRIVVLELAPGAADLDAEKIRASIGADLGADVVAPDDPRAASASGSIAVDVAQGKIVVTYTARAAPVVRNFPAPEAPDARTRAVVVVAENAARDESKEVLAGLEKKPEPAAPPPVMPDAPKPEGHLELFALRVWSGTRSFANLGFHAGIVPVRGDAHFGWYWGMGIGLTGPIAPDQISGSFELGLIHRITDRWYLNAGLAFTAEGDIAGKDRGDYAVWYVRDSVLWQATRFFGPYLGFGAGTLHHGDDHFAVEVFLGFQTCITKC
jgi:hypothetical protein